MKTSKMQTKGSSFKLHLFSLLLIYVLSISFANSVSADIGVNIGVGAAPVILINQFFIQPESIAIGNPANFTIEVTNIGNVDGNVSSIIQIYDGNNVIDTFNSNIHVAPYLPPNNIYNVSVIHVLNYPVRNYIALGFINYNNKTVGPIFKNFSINQGLPPSIYLISPSNHSWTNFNNDSLLFTFYVNDIDSYQFDCTLYLDGIAVGRNSSTLRNFNTSLRSNISFADGIHQWYIKCVDNGNNIAQSEIWKLNTGSFCANIDTPGLNYALNKNVTGDNSCFTITGDNVTIDCQGNTIFFNSGSAISINSNNVTVKNCIIKQNLFLEGTGINANGQLSALNNTIDLIGDYGTGIKLSVSNNSITNNYVYVNGSFGTVLLMSNSSGNVMQDNYFSINSSSSRFVFADENSINDITNNNYSSPFQEFIMSFEAAPAELNITFPSVGLTPSLNIFVPSGIITNTTSINVTIKYGNYSNETINVATNLGYAMMFINITSSRPVVTNSSNPIVMTMNISSLNLRDEEISRLGFFYYNSSSNIWESQASECNISSKICVAYITHFSEFSLILKVISTKVAERESRQLPLEGKLFCTKELAEIITEPGAFVEVTFLERPYSGMLVKSGNADSNGKFNFIADLPGRYNVKVSKSGLANNSYVFTARDDCVPTITFVRKWLDCSAIECILTMPVMSTTMENVEIDLSDVLGILSGSLNIRDKFGWPVNFYTYVGTELTFPLITDRFVIESPTKVEYEKDTELDEGRIEISLFNKGNTARVSGFIFDLSDLGTNYIKNVTYFANGQTIEIKRYSLANGNLVIDHQLYVPSTASFIISVTPIPLTCLQDSDCPSDSICQLGTCVVIPCSCGYIIERSCVRYECCADSDCAPGKSCISHVCVYTPPTITEEEKRIIADRLSVLISTIKSAREEGQDVTTAIQLLDQAKAAYEAGDFETAKQLIAQAQQIFEVSREVTVGFPYVTAMLVGVVILLLILAILIIKRLSSKRYRRRK